MVSLRRLLLSCLVVISGAAAAFGSNFEGIIHTAGKLWEGAVESQIFIKGQKVRLDVVKWANDQPVVYLYDVGTHTMRKLMPAQKTVTAPFAPDLEAGSTGRKKKVPPLVKTGKTGTIAGYPAEQYIRTFEDGRVNESWVTTRIQMSREVAHGMIPFVGRLARDDMYSFVDQRFTELRKVWRLADGSVWFENEVTKVEQTSLSDDLFAVPADYQWAGSGKTKEAATIGMGEKDQ